MSIAVGLLAHVGGYSNVSDVPIVGNDMPTSAQGSIEHGYKKPLFPVLFPGDYQVLINNCQGFAQRYFDQLLCRQFQVLALPLIVQHIAEEWKQFCPNKSTNDIVKLLTKFFGRAKKSSSSSSDNPPPSNDSSPPTGKSTPQTLSPLILLFRPIG